jgi:hypothetical protein
VVSVDELDRAMKTIGSIWPVTFMRYDLGS